MTPDALRALADRAELLARGSARHMHWLDHNPERWEETTAGACAVALRACAERLAAPVAASKKRRKG